MRRLFLILALGCTGGDDTSDGDGGASDGGGSATGTTCGDDAWSVVHFETSDGVTLEADWKPGPAAGAGVVVLLHMIPPSYDRSGYPEHVREAIAATGMAVLNVDRRGAGGSDGVAKDAYEGPGGLADVEAAVRFVLSEDGGCPASPDQLVLIGASNGTTSVFDYTVSHDVSLPLPAANIWMSPGTYTETQQELPATQDEWTFNLSFPFLWLYPTNEPYADKFVADAPGAWKFVQNGTQHGTGMFDGDTLENETVAEITAWVAAVAR